VLSQAFTLMYAKALQRYLKQYLLKRPVAGDYMGGKTGALLGA